MVLAASLARAQGASPDPTAVEPPRQLEGAEASYPPDALAARREATVGLRLTIEADGQVSAADVVEPAGEGFDEAAQAAALRFRFAPARRQGKPVASRIVYRYSFRLPPGGPTGEAPTPSSPAALAPPAAPSAPDVTAPPAPAAAGGAAPGAGPVAPAEIVVRGQQGEGARRQRSADAVTVVELRRARQQGSDLGEVLARTQGVGVRRTGGLGSSARFSLNGLYDDQVRFFLDGVPLDAAGFPFGIANVPVNLVERAEVYRGVVPVRFGADALGGAVNLVTDARHATRALASLQVGSFGTYRATLEARYRHDPSGFIAGTSLFVDHALNNYRIDVEVPDARGRLAPATVTRFHDRYLARGAALEAGFIDRPWARRLLLRVFATGYDKELPHNTVMTVPYGEVTYGETIAGGTLRYEQSLGPGLELDVLASYSRRRIDFVDLGEWVYDWFGRRTRPRRVAGEIGPRPTDQSVWQDGALGRLVLGGKLAAGQVLRLSVSPTHTSRTGDERQQSDPASRDPLSARRGQTTLVSGLAHELTAVGGRLENIAFVKDYLYRAASEESLPGGIFRPLAQDAHRLGLGDSLRYSLTPWLQAKASYEYATRLPRPDELFGNGVLIVPNLTLEPERSHNGNLGPRVELRDTPAGDLTVDVNAFVRDTDRQIVLLGNDRVFSFQNLYRARSLGLESAVAWASPRRLVSLDGTLTYQDQRNVSSEGPFGAFEGDRVPNRPYLFASWGARLRLVGVLAADDSLEPFYLGRYTHTFFRGWESQGLREFKQTVPSQLTHTAGLTHTTRTDSGRLSSTLEVQNLTDARVYDLFGVQRPGRAFSAKVTAEFD